MSDAIATSLVGSYPQPDWLVDREALNQRLPLRLRARELWRIDAAWLRDAPDDAVIVAIADQERAGLSIITDGEIRREGYSNHFANALEGVDLKHPGTIVSRAGTTAMVPVDDFDQPLQTAVAAGRRAQPHLGQGIARGDRRLDGH